MSSIVWCVLSSKNKIVGFGSSIHDSNSSFPEDNCVILNKSFKLLEPHL